VPFTSMAVQSQAVWALTGQKGGPVKLWTVRAQEGMCHHTFKDHTSTVSSVKILPGEKGFISGSWDKTLIVWPRTSVRLSRLQPRHIFFSFVSALGS